MLLEIRSFNEAARALMVSVALVRGRGAGLARRGQARKAADDRIGLLTPVLKGVFTDIGFANAVKAQQVLGGHGYVAEWGLEQFVRDARIAMIYEGANGDPGARSGRPQARQGRRARADGFLRGDQTASSTTTRRTRRWRRYLAPVKGGLRDNCSRRRCG